LEDAADVTLGTAGAVEHVEVVMLPGAAVARDVGAAKEERCRL